MLLDRTPLVVGVGCLALLARLAVAGDVDSTTPAATGNAETSEKDAKLAVAGQSIAQLIEQLDAADYDTREAACGKLASKGKAAIAALEKAAAHGNLEVSSRATTVLGKLLKASDEATEKAANDALEHLANGDSPAAARKAKAILDKKNGLQNNDQKLNPPGITIPGNGFGGQIIINGGQLNIGGLGGMRTMSVKNVNGVKEISASEDGKTVKIQDDPAQGIKIEFTEKQNGKEVTKKYDAKNVEELKKKQPAGYELYKKYGGEQPGNGIMQLRVQAGGNLQMIPGNAIPAFPLQPALPLMPGQLAPVPAGPAVAPPQGDSRQVEAATMVVKNLSSRLERLQKSDACKNASPESKAELKKQVDELSSRLEKLRGQLGDK
jgi:hypothetical protein